MAEKLHLWGVNTLEDLLFLLPHRYEDRTRIVPIGSLMPGQSAVIEGSIDFAQLAFSRSGKSRRMLLCHVSDGTGAIMLRFFHFSQAQQNQLSAGKWIRCFSEVRPGPKGLEMVHPEYELSNEPLARPKESHLTPVYPTTEGIHQLLLRKLTAQALAMMQQGLVLDEILPASLSEEHQQMSLAQALQYIHRPPVTYQTALLGTETHPARQRLVFEELLAHHLALLQKRYEVRHQQAIALESSNRLAHQLVQTLPFELTAAQLKVTDTLLQDMESARPMMRLVQGDVGSGKTMVAILACLKAIEAGCQAAFMAPTEILAEQHFETLTKFLQPLHIRCDLLLGKVKGKVRQQVLERLHSGETQLIVGTHALFQKDVEFKRLALIVIDEQHRFGVHQRLALRDKGASQSTVPHQLIMTATPIPRTLAMTAYADLDYSVIDELPEGRQPVTTVVLPEQRREEVIARVMNACQEGRQVYWVCTLIEESEALQCQAAEDTYALLQATLPELAIGLVHGRMKAAEKNQIMSAFKQGNIHLLVATTVIEVGVDVPNASLMIIENAERLGLSQLHQLRGRVGRGSQTSHCVLMYKDRLSQSARERLAIMRETTDGFEIASKDLEIRGPGEILGTRQTGIMQFRIADIIKDEALLEPVRQTADIVQQHHRDIIEPLIHRWLGKMQQYGEIG